MRKVKMLLFIICGFILCTSVVKAEGPYLLDWETAKERDAEYTDNIPFKDGYVVYNGYIGNNKIVYYDKSGQEIKSISNENFLLSMSADDDYLYGVFFDKNEKTIIIKYDSNLKIVKKSTISDNAPSAPLYAFYQYYKLMYISDKIAIANIVEDKIVVIDKNLEEVSNENASKANIKKYFPNYPSIDFWKTVEPYSDFRILVDYKNNKYVYSSGEYICKDDDILPPKGEANGETSEPSPECYKAYITLLDDNFDEVWEKELKDYIFVNSVKFIDDYILVSAYKDEDVTDLLVFDLKGNIVQTIKGKSVYQNIEDTPRGFIVTQTTCPYILVSSVDSPENVVLGSTQTADLEIVMHRDCIVNHQVYYLYHKIETKVTKGKGKIEVIGKQKAGEPVTFKVTPDEGYVLSKVLVTDANGNTVVFTNNVFTMPNADVTIEAIFVKKPIIPINPETSALSMIVLASAIGSFALLIFFNKKYKFLK